MRDFKMFVIKSNLVLLLVFFHVYHCERRIINGSVISTDKSYVVYIVKATISERRYDTWLCGGALVSTEFIITSAACVEDVDFLYAIAGYRKYVTDKFIPHDECTETMKKKIVYTCVPVAYQFSYVEIEQWSFIDIALVKVESPYNLNDARYQVKCSYIPNIITINYDPKRQVAGVDAMVMGWGHPRYWRAPSDNNNYNQDIIHYTSVSLLDKEVCKKEYTDYPGLVKTIEKYMICSLEPGNINDNGEPITQNPPMDGCVTQKQKLMGYSGAECEAEIVETADNTDHVLIDTDYTRDRTRKHMSFNETNDDVTNKTGFINGTSFVNGTNFTNGIRFVYGKSFVNKTSTVNKPSFISRLMGNTRRNGICQNDHGGPLVTWAGSQEVLIGIASVFRITRNGECVGPFLYTSTMCNGAFISCVLHQKTAKDSSATRQGLCDSPASVRGYDTIEKFVSWKHHPAGPAENEIGDEPKKKKGIDRFATNRNAEDTEIKIDPLSDGNTQVVNFPNLPPKTDLRDTQGGKGGGRFAVKIGPPLSAKQNYRIRTPVKSKVYAKNIENIPNPVKSKVYAKNIENAPNPTNDSPGGSDPDVKMRPQRPLRDNPQR